MPARSPFTSAMNTGTPIRDSCSAIVCKVTVLPVPVAPVTSPCLFASPGSSARTLSPLFATGSPSVMRQRYHIGRGYETLVPTSGWNPRAWAAGGRSEPVSHAEQVPLVALEDVRPVAQRLRPIDVGREAAEPGETEADARAADPAGRVLPGQRLVETQRRVVEEAEEVEILDVLALEQRCRVQLDAHVGAEVAELFRLEVAAHGRHAARDVLLVADQRRVRVLPTEPRHEATVAAE